MMPREHRDIFKELLKIQKQLEDCSSFRDRISLYPMLIVIALQSFYFSTEVRRPMKFLNETNSPLYTRFEIGERISHFIKITP